MPKSTLVLLSGIIAVLLMFGVSSASAKSSYAEDRAIIEDLLARSIFAHDLRTDAPGVRHCHKAHLLETLYQFSRCVPTRPMAMIPTPPATLPMRKSPRVQRFVTDNILLAAGAAGQLDPMCNACRKESTGPGMPRPPRCIVWSRTTSRSSSASGTSATNASTDSGVPLCGASSTSTKRF